MIRIFLLSFCLSICSFGANAQNTFTFSDSVFEVGQTQTFQDIRFELNKSDLLLDSICKPFLDSIVSFCLEHPEISIEVGVCLDIIGLEFRSSDLSGDRARKLRLYILDHGVNAFNVIPVGYGGEKPIHHRKYVEQFKTKDRKKYEQLRRENRRVVLKVIDIKKK